MNGNRDRSVLLHIQEYCDRIEDTENFFKHEKKEFLENHVFRDAVALCLMQIGELSGVLTEDFREKHSNVPWRQIKALRNIVAHKYGTIDAEMLWDILKEDVPKLRQYCEEILAEELYIES